MLNIKLTGCVCLALCTLVASAGKAAAEQAPAPVGVWSGPIQGGGTLTVVVTGAGMSYQPSGAAATVGGWTWNATSRGGIITLHYYNAGRPVRAYYSVTYINAKQVIFSDPYFMAVLTRR